MMSQNQIESINLFNTPGSWRRISYKVTGLIKDILYLAFLFGFFVLAGYFCSIGYVPAANLESLFYVILVIEFVGLSIILLYTSFNTFAPLIWSQLLNIKNVRHLIIGNKSFENNRQFQEELQKNVTLRFRIVFIYYFCMLTFMGLFYLSTHYLLNDNPNNVYYARILYSLGILFGIIFLIVLYELEFHSSMNLQEKEGRFAQITNSKFFSIYKIVSLSFVSAILLSLSATFLSGLFQLHIVPVALITIFLSCPILTPLPYWNKYVWSAVMGFSTSLLLFVCVDNFCGTVIKIPRFGGFLNQTIETDYRGCQLILRRGYSSKDPKICKKNEFTLFENVDVLWRIGEAYLRIDTLEGKKKFSMPLEHLKDNF